VHQAFGLGQFGEGPGELPGMAFQLGNHAMPDQHADIPAGAGFGQAGAQADQAGFRLTTREQQVAFVKR